MPNLAMTPDIRTQLRGAYRAMTRRHIDPGAPDSDTFAEWFWREEQTDTFAVGCCDYHDRPAMAYIVTALRHLCAVERHTTIRLLELAIADLKARP